MSHRVAGARGALAWLSAAWLSAAPAGAQSLAERVTAAGEGVVTMHFAARPGVCGDGRRFIGDGYGGRSRIVQEYHVQEGSTFTGRMRELDAEPCLPGPVRVALAMRDGRVARVRTYAGPVAAEPGATQLGAVSARDAAAFLLALARNPTGKVSEQAILPLTLADSVVVWPDLLGIARDRDRPGGTRRSAAFWLSRAAAARSAPLAGDAEDDRDEESDGSAAIFALSQLHNGEGIDPLIRVARENRDPALRRKAIFWLGQSGDDRALRLFEEILRGK